MCWGSLAAVAASKPHLEHIGGSTPIRIQLLQLLSPIILVLSIRRATACAFHRICSGLRCMHQVLNNGFRAMLRMLRPMPLRFRKLRGNEVASQRLLRCDLLIRVRFELARCSSKEIACRNVLIAVFDFVKGRWRGIRPTDATVSQTPTNSMSTSIENVLFYPKINLHAEFMWRSKPTKSTLCFHPVSC